MFDGLSNDDQYGKSENICFINTIVQCLANTAHFVEWLLENCTPSQLMMANKFCSFCALYEVICDIHHELRNEYSSSDSTCATAKPIAQYLEQLLSAFRFGEQGDPSEFLVVLLGHLILCVKINKTVVDMNSSLQPIQQIFGLNIVSIIECKICSKTSSVDTWESILSLPISSYSDLSESISAYFTIEDIKNGDLYSCSNCGKMPEKITLDGYSDETCRQSHKENENHSFIDKLNSVVVHLGEYATNGHVYAYVCSPDGYWYIADGELLTPVHLDLVLNHKDAYTLSYVKMLKRSLYLSDNETISSPTHSSSVIISSTPIVSL
ncbi:unnamed protein product [Rotaria magnacalcarata]|uniref:Ubiquitin carboxyl-terminal hydrolase 36 n=1 Tax=Rotaria magnacalcarata TaxID=392030 RepID=A0A816UK30_9BILA|nr:unnamed protein product [Rotaria magnacalcarata]